MLIEKLEDGSYKVCLAFEYQRINTDALIDLRVLEEVVSKGIPYLIEYGHPLQDMFSKPTQEWKELTTEQRSERFKTTDSERLCAVVDNFQIETLPSSRRVLTAILKPHGPFADKVTEHVERTNELKFGCRAYYRGELVTSLIAWDVIDNDLDVCITYDSLKTEETVMIIKYWLYRLSEKPTVTFDSVKTEDKSLD